MNCLQAEELLHAYLDHRIGAQAALELGKHLAHCSACGALHVDLVTLAARVSVIPERPDEGRMASAVLEKLFGRGNGREERKWIRRKSAWLWKPAAAAALLACCFELGVRWARLPEPAPSQAARTEPPPGPALGTHETAGPASMPEPDRTNPGAAPEPPSRSPETDPSRKPFNAQKAVRELYVSPPITAEDRERGRQYARLVNDLWTPDKRAAAAKELAGLVRKDESGYLQWQLAAAVSNSQVGAEVFRNIASLEPDVSLTPVYIAALGSGKTRSQAVDLLQTISGQRFGSQREVWMEWWAGVVKGGYLPVVENRRK